MQTGQKYHSSIEPTQPFEILLLHSDPESRARIARGLKLWFGPKIALFESDASRPAEAQAQIHRRVWDLILLGSGPVCGENFEALDRMLSGCRRLEIPVVLISSVPCEIKEFALWNGAIDRVVPANAKELDPGLRNLIGTLLRLHQRRFRGAGAESSAWYGASLLDLRESRDAERALARQLDSEKRKLQNAFGLYVDTAIIEGILNKEIPLEQRGNQREVSVLFADIRGYTSIAETMNPQHVISFLNEFFTAMTEVIIDQRGMIDKYIGDSIMCLFGALDEDPEHNELAVTAALAMQAAFARWRPGWVRNYGFEPGLGIGVAGGPVILGNVGSFQKLSYTAVGDVVNLAARLESFAGPGEVIVSSALWNSLPEDLRARHAFEELNDLDLKGKKNNRTAFRWRERRVVPALAGEKE